MHGVLGQFFCLLGLAFAAAGTFLAPIVALRDAPTGLRRLRQLSLAYAACMLAANAAMVRALLVHDFSVSYVAQVGSRATPPLISVVSLWSSLAGSILFWGLVLGVYLTAFVWRSRRMQGPLVAWSLGVTLAVAAFFAYLVAGPASPFGVVNPVPADGPGPNPLLQNHWLMAVHPPMLYLGYVGMTLPFSVAIAALLHGSLPPHWMALLRRCVLWPWAFLSVGIVLGSWWAYEVLGWGGFWAWDPVENASFLPWLAATGYLHAAAVQQRRGVLKAWTVVLVLSSFLLTILGTFMTRSGVFNSVHSFTQSPIGPLFLAFLAVVSLLSLVLVGGRSHLLEDEGEVRALASRETAFVLNNVALVVFTFTVLLGTVYPLLTEAITGTKLSVGEPYFDRMAAPLGMLLVLLMGVGPVLPWGRPELSRVRRDFFVPTAAGVVVGVATWLMGARGPLMTPTFALCGFAAFVNLRELFVPGLRRARQRKQFFARGLVEVWTQQGRRSGGAVVHLAIVVIAAGITAAQGLRTTTEASLSRGDQVNLGPYTLTYEGAVGREEPHRFAALARVRVERDGEVLGRMEPRLNFYPSQREPVATPHVVTLGSTDLYLSLMSIEAQGARITLKGYLIPLVAWLWRSIPLLVLGSMLSLWPRRSELAARHGKAHDGSASPDGGAPPEPEADRGQTNRLPEGIAP